MSHHAFQGELSMYTLSREWKKMLKQRPQSGEWVVNCEGVTKMDSAGLALLLDMLRYARQKNIVLKIKNLPEAVLRLMEAQGVSGILKEVIDV